MVQCMAKESSKNPINFFNTTAIIYSQLHNLTVLLRILLWLYPMPVHHQKFYFVGCSKEKRVKTTTLVQERTSLSSKARNKYFLNLLYILKRHRGRLHVEVGDRMYTYTALGAEVWWNKEN